MTPTGWAELLGFGVLVGTFDIGLQRVTKTTLSDTWIHGSKRRTILPFEVATFASLGAHLFFGLNVYYLIGSTVALVLIGAGDTLLGPRKPKR